MPIQVGDKGITLRGQRVAPYSYVDWLTPGEEAAAVAGGDAAYTTVRGLSAAEIAAFRLVVGGDTSVPASAYWLALRAAQGDFGPWIDQSPAKNDATLNLNLNPPGYNAAAVYTANQYVSPSVPNGFIYRVTTANAAAAGTEPATWTTTLGGTSSSGGGTVFTCERGPFYLDAGIRQARSLANAMFTPTSLNGAVALPNCVWDLANGDSLIINVSGAFNYTNGGHANQNLAESIVLGNVRPAGAASRRGFRMFATGTSGTAFNDLRLSIFDGTTARVAAHLSAGAANKPGDGNRRTTTCFIDGKTKRMFLCADGAPRSSANDYTGVNTTDLVAWNADISAVTGSTQSDAPTFIGATPATSGPGAASTSFEFGFARVDILPLRDRGLPADIVSIAQWFHNRGEGLLPASMLLS